MVTHTTSCWRGRGSEADPGLLHPGWSGMPRAYVSVQTQILGAAPPGLPSALVDPSLLGLLLLPGESVFMETSRGPSASGVSRFESQSLFSVSLYGTCD